MRPRFKARFLDGGEMGERQGALAILSEVKEPGADELLNRWLDRLLKDEVPSELRLDLLEAAAQKTSKEIKAKLAKYNAARKKDDPLAASGRWPIVPMTGSYRRRPSRSIRVW